MARIRLLAALSILTGACAPRATRLSARDGAMRGRDIALTLKSVRGGVVITGRLRVAVPPETIVDLLYQPRALVRLFPARVAGSGLWPHGREARFFLASRLFGKVFATWGFLTQARRRDWIRLRWRTDRDGWGYLIARKLGAGSDLRVGAYVPTRTRLASSLAGLGAEILLRLAVYSFRFRLERLWRRRALPAASGPLQSSWAGVAPRTPRAPPGNPSPRSRSR